MNVAPLTYEEALSIHICCLESLKNTTFNNKPAVVDYIQRSNKIIIKWNPDLAAKDFPKELHKYIQTFENDASELYTMHLGFKLNEFMHELHIDKIITNMRPYSITDSAFQSIIELI